MIEVHVEYMAQLRLRAGLSKEVVSLDEESSIADLLLAIAEKHGDSLRPLVLEENGTPSETLLCFVRDEQQSSDYSLSEGDSVTLMPPISGG